MQPKETDPYTSTVRPTEAPPSRHDTRRSELKLFAFVMIAATVYAFCLAFGR